MLPDEGFAVFELVGVADAVPVVDAVSGQPASMKAPNAMPRMENGASAERECFGMSEHGCGLSFARTSSRQGKSCASAAMTTSHSL